MTNRAMVSFDLKQVMETVNAWRSRVLTISHTSNINEKLKLINSLGKEMEITSEILCRCVKEDLVKK